MWEYVVNILVNILLWIYRLVGGDFGLAIILFTILIKVITYPLQAKQIKSTQGMQEMQQSKKWQDIQKKYKGEKEKLAQEQMKMYQEAGISPFASCLPMFIQLPIMFALYQSIVRAVAATPLQLIHLSRGVFSLFDAQALVPLNSKFLWMNLGQPERVYIFGVGIPLLAILVVVTSYIQTKVSTPPVTNPGDQTAAMSGMMSVYMPLMMGWITYSLASGLAVYFIISSLLAIAQQAMMGRVYWSNLLPKKMRPK
ncbi:MAG: YidC/Oxa1 family membrane protein insertase [Chloroflexi bacterium]|nr:YidC/Oxa1 family membrane protein insertase [Chloroflexota bacterium]